MEVYKPFIKKLIFLLVLGLVAGYSWGFADGAQGRETVVSRVKSVFHR